MKNTVLATTELNRALAFMQYNGEDFFIIDGIEVRAWEGTEAEAKIQYDEYLKSHNEQDEPLSFYEWVCENLTEVEEQGDDNFNDDYLVCTDAEAETRWDESLESYIDECIFGTMEKGIRDTVGPYFDREAWKSDAMYDGRGHSLAGYDGHEKEETVNGETFYIYRQN